ncbi:hypothetical protein ACFPRL_17530 [Pseudoclavibacter helvolus]
MRRGRPGRPSASSGCGRRARRMSGCGSCEPKASVAVRQGSARFHRRRVGSAHGDDELREHVHPDRRRLSRRRG